MDYIRLPPPLGGTPNAFLPFQDVITDYVNDSCNILERLLLIRRNLSYALGWCPFSGIVCSFLFNSRFLFGCCFVFSESLPGESYRFAPFGDRFDQSDCEHDYGDTEYQDGEDKQ